VQHITSKDGTRIAYEIEGNGPHLIIIGGSLGDHRFYVPLAGDLAHQFTVYNFDRRGRGQSGDTKPYSVEREVEDVAALIDDAGKPALVYGHSAGAALALHAAAAGLSFAKLVLADPPFGRHSDADGAATARQAEKAATIQSFHDRGDHRGAAAFFLGGFGLPPKAVDEMLNSPAGESMIDCARALPYDFALVGDGLVPNELAARVSVPTLILAAETAPATAQDLVAIMPRAHLQTMRASTHDLAASEIASAVTPFFHKREGQP
jgi:pimeloyl-ACP methyl ester carboxylesterase